MERRNLIWKDDPRYSDFQISLLGWAQRRMESFVDSVLIKQEVSENQDVTNLHSALLPKAMFGGLQIKFPQRNSQVSQGTISQEAGSTRLASFVEFAYIENYPHLPEQIHPFRPALIVKKLPPFVEQTIDTPKPGEFVIDQIPSPAREALEMAVGIAGMHFLAQHFADSGNLTYFYENISMASRLHDVTKHLGSILGIDGKVAAESLGVDAEVAYGIEDLLAFMQVYDSDPGLKNRRIHLTKLRSTAEYLINHPIDFIFVRAAVMPNIAAQQLHLRNTPAQELVAIFLQRSSTVMVNLLSN